MTDKKKSLNVPLTTDMLEALKKLGSSSSEPPCLQVLGNFNRGTLLDFIVRAKRMYKNDPDLKIIDWLSGKICYKLETMMWIWKTLKLY
eukprot:snap_masked-scaffold_97-processed-gene-0.13-mRNA-1 protein AED:1.00 eAED:1.00 QI:0/-1/0/0/-1/1/1/0/88